MMSLTTRWPMILSSLKSGANPRSSFSGPVGPSCSRRADSVWMNSPMEQATWSARFLCTNHMGQTQHTASARLRAVHASQPNVRLARPTTEGFLKSNRCDIFARRATATRDCRLHPAASKSKQQSGAAEQLASGLRRLHEQQQLTSLHEFGPDLIVWVIGKMRLHIDQQRRAAAPEPSGVGEQVRNIDDT